MSAQHTPGPWSIEDPMGPEIISIVCGEDFQSGIDIAQIGTTGEGSNDRRYLEHMANARLIAAAPELLEALEASFRMEWARRNREAISDPLHPGLLGAQIELEKANHEFATLRDAAIAKAKGEPA